MLKSSLIALALLTLGCSSSDKSDSVKEKAPTSAIQVEMQNASHALIAGFMKNLKSELMSAIKEGGVASAIGACQVQAPQVADSFSQENWSIKRVTEKPRNQTNKADAHQQEILGYFADSLKTLKFFDEWKDSEAKTGYTYYQPIKMGKFCLKCHGDTKALDEEVTLALQDKYPDDKALNYNAGDLRGMFVVQINSADNLPPVQQALRDSL